MDTWTKLLAAVNTLLAAMKRQATIREVFMAVRDLIEIVITILPNSPVAMAAPGNAELDAKFAAMSLDQLEVELQAECQKLQNPQEGVAMAVSSDTVIMIVSWVIKKVWDHFFPATAGPAPLSIANG